MVVAVEEVSTVEVEEEEADEVALVVETGVVDVVVLDSGVVVVERLPSRARELHSKETCFFDPKLFPPFVSERELRAKGACVGYTIWGLKTHWTHEILFLFFYLDNILLDFRCWLVGLRVVLGVLVIDFAHAGL